MKLRKKNNYLLLIFTIYILMSCSKQPDSFIRDFDDDMEKEDDTPEGFLRIGIVHHISRNDAGSNAVANEQIITKVMADINNNFEPAEIVFYTKAIKFVDNTQWNNQFVKQDDFRTSKVLSPFEDAAALNLFYFDNLKNRSNGQITGSLGATALFPDQGNNIKLSSSAYANQNTATVTHEIGHYLGLYHTSDDFRDVNGNIELVDGSNCTNSGDFICDTPASPDLNSSNINESNCMYTGTETDANGMPYSPDSFNYMTQWAGADSNGNLCRRRFSPGQIDKMVSVVQTERAYLIE